jgi:hypothetical protein
LCKIFWVFTRRRFVLVRNQRFGTTSLSHLQGLQNPLLIHLETLKIGQISSPETLVPYQKKKKRRRIKTQKTLHNKCTRCNMLFCKYKTRKLKCFLHRLLISVTEVKQ